MFNLLIDERNRVNRLSPVSIFEVLNGNSCTSRKRDEYRGLNVKFIFYHTTGLKADMVANALMVKLGTGIFFFFLSR